MTEHLLVQLQSVMYLYTASDESFLCIVAAQNELQSVVYFIAHGVIGENTFKSL